MVARPWTIGGRRRAAVPVAAAASRPAAAADDPRKDLDMASYSITKTIKDRPDAPRSDWHWEPKEAFHALARRYACRAH